jgi:biopolymer transport protein ExbD
MVSAVFKQYRGIPVRLPAASKTEKLPGKRNVAYIWADDKNRISIDDKFLNTNEISDIIYAKVSDQLNPLRVVSMKIDERAKMGFVSKIHEELRETGGAALNVNYSTKTASK